MYHEVTSFMTSLLSSADISAPQVFKHRFDCIFRHVAATETGPLRNIPDPTTPPKAAATYKCLAAQLIISR